MHTISFPALWPMAGSRRDRVRFVRVVLALTLGLLPCADFAWSPLFGASAGSDAPFNAPSAAVVHQNLLYVADRGNHLVIQHVIKAQNSTCAPIA